MRIGITDYQNKIKLDKRILTRCAEVTLSCLKEKKAEISLLVVTDAYMRRLNRKYRGVDSTTDVLAFSVREGMGGFEKSDLLGDVVISAQTAAKEALKRKVSLYLELCLYLIHGILHLVGYDDATPLQSRKMKAREKEILYKFRLVEAL